MSEEQPQFKVTDRRLFNADGTPREIAAEEEAGRGAARDNAQGEAADTGGASTAPAASAVSEPESATSADSARAESPEDFAGQPDEEVEGAQDPASFVNFLMSIASNAAAALGMMEHPVTGERGVDLQLGKHWIDVLGMLEQKTRGNLSSQEERILEGLLADLRMQFVSLSQPSPSAKQRFTGRDILGGK
ncbi:MAG TPA: DUF1844 domain-containing protein [Pyrinomonadaceae bacterium]|jgi:hypothetical protein